MSSQFVDFGIDLESDYSLFCDEFENAGAVFVIYTPKKCLEIGSTDNLKEALEMHEHTKEWLDLSAGNELMVAFYPEEDPIKREEVKEFLIEKMNPLCQ
jgi:hypothetical protein